MFTSFYLLFLAFMFLFIPILIGVYVYKDATSRGMNASLWTLIAVLSPAVIGLIIYLVVRSDYSALQCPNCNAPVNEQFRACPTCGTPLKNQCPSCNQPLEATWKICPFCSEPVPEGSRSSLVEIKKDSGLGRILFAVILIPVVIIVMLGAGLMNFRNTYSSNISYFDDMRAEDFANDPTVSDWLEACNASGTGVYVLEYVYPENAKGGWNRSNYIIYRKGLTHAVEVSAVTGSRGLFGGEALKIAYVDSDSLGASDYHLYQLDYSTTSKPVLEVYVNGKKTTVQRTPSPFPLGYTVPMYWRNNAIHLFEHRIPYLGDNSGVLRLIEETGLSHLGDFTIELKTDQKPLGLRIVYSSFMDEFDMFDFIPSAIELLGLIENLDYVEITDGIKTVKLTNDEASAILGHDVKDLGKSIETLEEYVRSFYEDGGIE